MTTLPGSTGGRCRRRTAGATRRIPGRPTIPGRRAVRGPSARLSPARPAPAPTRRTPAEAAPRVPFATTTEAIGVKRIPRRVRFRVPRATAEAVALVDAVRRVGTTSTTAVASHEKRAGAPVKGAAPTTKRGPVNSSRDMGAPRCAPPTMVASKPSSAAPSVPVPETITVVRVVIGLRSILDRPVRAGRPPLADVAEIRTGGVDLTP